MKTSSEPIFIHSLFRSGSTYIFNVFRRSRSRYCCYYEPLNEYVSYTASDPQRLLSIDKQSSAHLRHPALAKPYFEEYYRIAPEVGRLFRKEFSFDEYFLPADDESSRLKDYLELLIDKATGRPVFGCCRTTGRVAYLREKLGGYHIFIWRNPWDQWWSYRRRFEITFDTNNLLIANASRPPAFLATLKKELELPELHLPDAFAEYEFFGHQWLDASSSYTLFYALWCHSMLEARTRCDLTIRMDQLSVSPAYRSSILDRLAQQRIRGLDFSDCALPMAEYGETDRSFFAGVEERVHALLLEHGYSQAELDEVAQERGQLSPKRPARKTAGTQSRLRDLGDTRSMVRDYEGKLARSWRAVVARDQQIEELRANIVQLTADLEQASLQRQELVGRMAALETDVARGRTEAHQWWMEADRWWREADRIRQALDIVYGSHSWRLTAPLRGLHFRQHLSDFVGAAMRLVRRVPGMSPLLNDLRSRHPDAWYALSSRVKVAPASPFAPPAVAAPVSTAIAIDLAEPEEEQHFLDLFQHEIARRQADVPEAQS